MPAFPRALVLLNGPPRCGKDTGAAELRRLAGPRLVQRLGFADELKTATHAAYGLLDADGRPLPALHFERVKDDRRAEFLGLTPRHAYIYHSEGYMKPKHGPDVFGRLFERRLELAEAPVVVVPDSGFASEAVPLRDRIGAERVLLVRIHAEDRGCSFAGDSRSHIALRGVMSRDLRNNVAGDPAPFLRELARTVADFLETLDDAEMPARRLRRALRPGLTWCGWVPRAA